MTSFVHTAGTEKNKIVIWSTVKGAPFVFFVCGSVESYFLTCSTEKRVMAFGKKQQFSKFHRKYRKFDHVFSVRLHLEMMITPKILQDSALIFGKKQIICEFYRTMINYFW